MALRAFYALSSSSSATALLSRGLRHGRRARKLHLLSTTAITLQSMKRPAPPSAPTTPPPDGAARRNRLRKAKTIPMRQSFVEAPMPDVAPRDSLQWAPLDLDRSELSLPLTFPTGQTFRWKQTGPAKYTGAIGPHLVSLKHLEDSVISYCIHNPAACGSVSKMALLDFLNAGVSLAEVWAVFSAADGRFSELARHLEGARVLRQDPLECLIQFLCSSNNNIARITKMVGFISSLGKFLGSVEGFDFHEFPSLEQLSEVTEGELRDAGFGYRAKYIVGTVNALTCKPGGGVEWLRSLRKMDLPEVIDALCTLPGVGPKVAACIALFSLDQHHAIPVDTHVWQIATRHLLPELAGTRLTSKLCTCVADAFVTKYGKYAGWAQTVLFIAELPPQKAILQSHVSTVKKHKVVGCVDGDSC